MNLPVNPTLTMTIAADRHRTLVAEAELRRVRTADRLARRTERQARKAARRAATATTPTQPPTRPQLQPVPTGAATVRQHVTSSDLEHASARVA